MWTAIIAALTAGAVAIISTAAMEKRRKREQVEQLRREAELLKKEKCNDR